MGWVWPWLAAGLCLSWGKCLPLGLPVAGWKTLGLGSSTCALVCAVDFWALWCTGLCPGMAVDSGSPKDACHVAGGATTPPGLLLGPRHPSTGAYSLVGRGWAWVLRPRSCREGYRIELGSPSVHKLPRQLLSVPVPQGELWVPPFQETLQDQQMGLTQAPFK